MRTFILTALYLALAYSSVAAVLRTSLLLPQNKYVRNSDEAVEQFLFDNIELLNKPEWGLQRTYKKSTKHSSHYTYAVHYKQWTIEQAFVKLSIDMRGKILSVKTNLPDIESIQSLNETMLTTKPTIQLYRSIDSINKIHISQNSSINNCLLIRDEKTIPAVKYSTWNKSHDDEYVINFEGEILHHYSNLRYYRKDTIIQMQVFDPDPLTVQNQVYGGTYVDGSDAALAWFVPAYSTKSCLAQYDTIDHLFHLENKYAVIEDFEAPNIAAATSTTSSMLYDRSQSGFEDCNVLYHITAYHDYISSLGYDSLMDLQVTVDAHGLFGGDNSVFNRNGGNPTLSFGVGGVDDAEDADVIIHEYSHGISWSANNNGAFTFERSGLDEGLADYFATSYSRSINPFGWERMFSWDGHNEYWGGRKANTTTNYPVTSNIYALGEIWNAAMSSLATQIGLIQTDKLMLESLHFFAENTTLPEAATYVLLSDSVLFAGLYHNQICSAFQNKQILTSDCKPVGTTTPTTTTSSTLHNTLAFASGYGLASLQFATPMHGSYRLISAQGTTVCNNNFHSCSRVDISPHSLQAGIYILEVFAGKEIARYKLIKW